MIAHDVRGEGCVAEGLDGKFAFPENTICPGGASVFFARYQLKSEDG